METFKTLLLSLISGILLVLGVAFTSLDIHTSDLQYSVIGGMCLGFYELIKDN